VSGIVGAIGPGAVQAAHSMHLALKHRGEPCRCSRGHLANGTEYVVGALGQAQFSEARGSADSSITVVDACRSSYARARVVDSDSVLLDRDHIGSRPLFFGAKPRDALCAFASERKALWSLGINQAKRVDPRTTVMIHEQVGATLRTETIRKRDDQEHNRARYGARDSESAANDLRKLLESAMSELPSARAGAALSGGVDSCLLCAIAAKSDTCQYFATGFLDSHDLKSAQRAARSLQVDLNVTVLDLYRVEMLVPHVVKATESCNPLDVAIALPTYVLAQQIKTAGLKLMVSGQGADELFAGYARYKELASNRKALSDALERDLRNLAKDNLERDNLAAASHSIDIVLPYLDTRVVQFAGELDVSLKLHNGINKYVLRKAAAQLMPPELAYKQKKAMQYGTGVSAALRKLARRNLAHGQRSGKGAVSIYLRSIAEKHDIAVTA